jgi:nicotinamidase-related amidase
METQPISSLSTALLIVDMQRGMASVQAGERNNVAAEQNIARLLELWRSVRRAVVHIRHTSRPPRSLFSCFIKGLSFKTLSLTRDWKSGSECAIYPAPSAYPASCPSCRASFWLSRLFAFSSSCLASDRIATASD